MTGGSVFPTYKSKKANEKGIPAFIGCKMKSGTLGRDITTLYFTKSRSMVPFFKKDEGDNKPMAVKDLGYQLGVPDRIVTMKMRYDEGKRVHLLRKAEFEEFRERKAAERAAGQHQTAGINLLDDLTPQSVVSNRHPVVGPRVDIIKGEINAQFQKLSDLGGTAVMAAIKLGHQYEQIVEDGAAE